MTEFVKNKIHKSSPSFLKMIFTFAQGRSELPIMVPLMDLFIHVLNLFAEK